MSTKQRLLRIFLIVVLVLAFAGYFAFSTFLFSPTEGSLESDVSTLVPENVDFFVAKAKLIDDFAEFPTLKSAEAIEGTRAWGMFEGSGALAAAQKSIGWEALRAQLDELKKQTHGLNLLRIFGGQDVAVAGTIKTDNVAASDWCVYGRVNWMGKLAFSMCRYPGLLGFKERGIEVKLDPNHLEFSGAGLPRTIYAARIRDVVIAGTTLDLVQKAQNFEVQGGQGSFGQGAQYFDHIAKAPRNAKQNEFEVYVNYRDLAKAFHLPVRWPDAQSEDFGTALAGRLFQLGSINKLSGVVGFDGGIQATLHGDLSSELMTAVQQKLYRTRGADQKVYSRDIAKLARSDAALFVVAHAQLADLLREALAASEKALRANLEDLLRETGEFKLTDNAQTFTEVLLQELDALFRDRIALIVRVNDYPEDAAKDAPHDDTPTPAWTIALWTDGSDKSRQRIKDLQEMVNRHYRSFGISGRDAGERGVYTNNCSKGNYEIWEFWSRFVPGTGEISTAVDADLFLISNNFRMVCEVLNTRDNNRNDPNYPRLADRPDFMHLANDSIVGGNVMVWADPKGVNSILSKFTDRKVQDEIASRIDWKSERARLERDILKRDFEGKQPTFLTDEEKARFKESVDGAVKDLEVRLQSEQAPALRREYERSMTYWSTISAAVLLVALDPKHFDLSLRAYVPLGDGK